MAAESRIRIRRMDLSRNGRRRGGSKRSAKAELQPRRGGFWRWRQQTFSCHPVPLKPGACTVPQGNGDLIFMPNLQSALGVVAIVAIAFMISENRRAVPWRPV